VRMHVSKDKHSLTHWCMYAVSALMRVSGLLSANNVRAYMSCRDVRHASSSHYQDGAAMKDAVCRLHVTPLYRRSSIKMKARSEACTAIWPHNSAATLQAASCVSLSLPACGSVSKAKPKPAPQTSSEHKPFLQVPCMLDLHCKFCPCTQSKC